MRFFVRALGGLVFGGVSAASAASVIHIQSPWSSAPTIVKETHCLKITRSGVATSYEMTSEGDGWFVYTYEDAISETTTRTFTVTAGTETWSENVPLADILNYNSGSEVWVYVDASTGKYTLRATGPSLGTSSSVTSSSSAAIAWDTVWFKSPWGTKVAPQLIYGLDTLAMSFASDAEHCGWFYRVFDASGIAASMSVYFRKAESSFVYPSASTLDVGPSLSASGVAYVDGTSASPAVTASLGSAGECFDASYALHVYWSGSGALSVSGATFASETGMSGWYEADLGMSPPSTISVTAGSGNRGASVTAFDLSKTEIFPEGVYQAWIVLNANGSYAVSFARVSSFVIRILSPWTNTSPSLVIGSDTVPMTSVTDYCGWFETKYQGSADEFNVLFKQTVGTEIYTAAGLTAGDRIALDSVLSVSDTVWIRPAPVTKLPILYSEYPKVLGACPVKNLPVMMLDWYDGSRNNVSKYNPATRSAALGGATTYGGTGISSDFGGDNNNLCWPNSTPYGEKGDGGDNFNSQLVNDGTSVITGMVNKNLGANGVPVRSTTFDWVAHCKNAEYLNHWFIPDTIKVVNGKAYTNAACRELTLALDDDGIWRGQMDSKADSSTGAHLGGMFLLDDFQYLDSAKTIPNPYYDSIPSGFAGIDGGGTSRSNAYHNYGLSMKVQANFVYVPGQTFEFLGDDDVWVFINDKLVVDIGGVHDRRSRSVNLDTLGLTAGRTYSFYIFYTERYQVEGNFKMRTSIDLQTDQTYYLVKIPVTDGLLKYQTWQILREEGLSCDFSGMIGVDTSLAVSDFTLFGGALPSAGVILSEGANYGGIVIDTGYTGFTIDTAAIVRTRSLSPGTYTLRYSLKNDEGGTHYGEIYFVVPEYPLPDIVFTDSLWNRISADTTTLGEWARVAYPVRVAILYAGTACEGCSDVLYLASSDSLTFLDASGNTISSVTLENGEALFWVMGTGTVVNGSFTVAGTAVSNTLVWPDINLKTPPVPTIEIAEMFDRTGEGIPDSVYFRFSRPLTGKDAVDSLKWVYGDSAVHFLGASDAAASMTDSSTIVVTSAAGFTTSPFTGLQGVPYSGSVNTWFTYIPTTGVDAGVKVPFMMSGRINDKVGPIVLSATVSNKSSTLSVLSLTLSESLDGTAGSDSILQYRFWRAGVVNPTAMRASSVAVYNGDYHYDFYFESHQSELPIVGDSVRLAPGLATDLSGAHPHENNPWVRIVGEQKITTESTDLVEVGPDTSAVQGPAAKAVLVDESVSAGEASSMTGTHGELISFNMAEVLANENAIRGDSLPPLTMDSVAIHYEVYYYTNLGEYVNSAKGTIACSDSLFSGDCTTHKGNVFLAWNMRGKNGRSVGTGAYIAHLTLKATAGSKVVARSKENSVWGVRRTSR